MNKSSFLVATVLLCAVASFSAEAKLYKWVDAQGVTHYGETIPPEYANRDTKQLVKGRITDRSETFEVEKTNSAKKDSASEKALLEARRKDDALLNSYSNEKEIDLSRDRSLTQIEARINSFSTLIKSAQMTVDDLNRESDSRTKKGWKIPQSLTDDLTEAEARVVKLKQDLENSQKESDSVKARYEADKLRFRQLKGLSNNSAVPPQ